MKRICLFIIVFFLFISPLFSQNKYKFNPDIHFPVITFKFIEDSGVRLRGNTFISLSEMDMNDFNNFILRYNLKSIKRAFSRPEETLENEKISGEQKSGRRYQEVIFSG